MACSTPQTDFFHRSPSRSCLNSPPTDWQLGDGRKKWKRSRSGRLVAGGRPHEASNVLLFSLNPCSWSGLIRMSEDDLHGAWTFVRSVVRSSSSKMFTNEKPSRKQPPWGRVSATRMSGRCFYRPDEGEILRIWDNCGIEILDWYISHLML
ncbi:hypothetical protein DL98DRAFT_515188 [Cadophora sp. DSE1049]|nr:hypothetical protein DL98DRAFT_515188 [Cadophora sp. DSE1049]